jgi:hypothetical protein
MTNRVTPTLNDIPVLYQLRLDYSDTTVVLARENTKL